MRVVLTGGGTGGHVYPLLAIAEASPDWAIDYIGNQAGLEARIVPRDADVRFHAIRSGAIRGKRLQLRLRGALRTLEGAGEALRLLRRLRPDVVVSSGGYAGFPVALAAQLLHVPLVLVEPNAQPGLANRIQMRRAARILLGFEDSLSLLPRGAAGRAVATGVPIRPALAAADRAEARAALGVAPHELLVVAFGGSQGAEALSQAAIGVADALAPQERMLLAVGERNRERFRDRGGERLQIVPYIWDMARAYAAADLVLCRSGALTCAELTALGLPAILVPSPNVVADHQTQNARVLAGHGAAVLLPEAELTVARLGGELLAILRDGERRARMAQAARDLGRPDAAARAVAEITRVARAPRRRQR